MQFMMKNKKNLKRILLNALCAILLVLHAYQWGTLLYRVFSTQQVVKLNAQLVEMKEEQESQSDWSYGMKAVNEDYAGWLTVYGTNISLPVVQGETNEEYLHRSIHGDWSSAGTLFLDEDVDLQQDGNIIIYGHLMKDGTMFAELKKFKDKEFLKQEENRIIQWECESGTYLYKVFAVMIVPGSASDESFVNFREWLNHPEMELAQTMLQSIQENSFFYQPDFIRRPENQYLFLATCDYTKDNMRLVVVAERL